MEAVARSKNIRISTRKVRLVADSIRNLSVAKAMQLLLITKKHGAFVLIKTLKSAVANAVQKGIKEDELIIAQLEVDGGPTLRRMHVGSRSHMRMYTKRSTSIRIVVSNTKKVIWKTKKEVKQEKKEEKPTKEIQEKKKEKQVMKKERREISL